MIFAMIITMKNFKIVKDNKPSLRQRSTQIILPIEEELKQTLLDMLKYLKLSQNEQYAEKHQIRAGVGLAAPQIGINKDMIAIFYQDENNVSHEYCLINPVIISESCKLAYIESGEGCLSVDKQHPGYIYRPYKVTVKAFDLLKNKEMTYVFTGFGSMVVQHEIDHLKGILFYDHIDKKNPFKKLDDATII
jgi:peptide deformylase